MTPDVSILLPVKQWRGTTAAAVSSLLAQTHDSIEILVIGHDDVNDLVRRLPSDSRIRPVKRQEPGIVGALNTGIGSARGTYIARMDDDDIAYPNRLSTQLHYLQTHPQVQLCSARVRFIDSAGASGTIRSGNQQYAAWLNAQTEPTDIRNACWAECPMPHPTLLAHRRVWHRLGGYRAFDGPEDYDLILRAMLNGIGMGKPEPVLQDWREHTERLTYLDSRYRREAFVRCKVWAACHGNSGLGLDRQRSVWICGTGRNARNWHDELSTTGVIVNGFVDRPHSGATRTKRNKPVISYEQLAAKRGDSLIITALSQPQARRELKLYFDKLQWRSGNEYIMGG